MNDGLLRIFAWAAKPNQALRWHFYKRMLRVIFSRGEPSMASKTMPSEKQTRLLEDLGIPVPPSRAACRGLIAYVLKGTGSTGETVDERIAIAQSYNQKWRGKRVRAIGASRFYGQTGTVKYLVARTAADCRDTLRDLKDRGFAESSAFLHPFRATVGWDGRGSSVIRLSALEIIS